MAGSLRSGQLLLFVVRMFLPLKVGSSSVCGSWKSASQPTFGQMSGWFFGTLQNFVYIAVWSTKTGFTFIPIFARLLTTTCAVSLPGVALSATIVIAGPLYLPDLKPAFFSIAS